MKAEYYLKQLPEDFNTQVLNLSKNLGMDTALYLLIGKHVPEIDPEDGDLVEDLVELIVNKWNELEF